MDFLDFFDILGYYFIKKGGRVMVPTVKFSHGKEFFYESRNSSLHRSARMGRHHYHSLFEIYYFQKGECNYFIDDRTYSLMPGDVIIIPGNVIHRTLYTSNYERKLLNFTEHYIPESVKVRIPNINYLYRNPATAKEVKRIFDAIDADYRALDDFSDDSIMNLVKSLFILIARSDSIAMQTGGNSPFVAKTVKTISESYHSDITLNSLAESFSVSPEHLSRTFKKETGFGFNEYLTLVRLQKAEQFLASPEKRSVSEIAYACGFNDSNYFSQRFKEMHGISPLKYRQQTKER